MTLTVYLKSLTLRGFKSFADSTTLEFEPGVTVIVGPNGSGKSNVVDAVAWVLGAQGPRVVRSSKMDDVIFAGTAKRPALGRAEVSLTIDNSSRRLPVDMAEVTITRTLFRTGESEYSMNGAVCRLLDIQELLSDAGVGRQQHVIMGQGQLDTILAARPEDRRAVIEEAAGILKFRRRRERAERRLESTEQNLMRLQDLQREVRRQLRPLERQADAARRHDSLAAELRAVRLYLSGRELESLQRRLSEADNQHSQLEAEERQLRSELARLDDLVATTESALSIEQANDVVTSSSTADRLTERGVGLARLVAERRRGVAAALSASAETDGVAALEVESLQLAEALAATEQAGLALGPEWAEIERQAAELAAATAASSGGRTSPDDGEVPDAPARRRERDALVRRLTTARESFVRHAEHQAALERERAELQRALSDAGELVERLSGEVTRLRAELEKTEERERLAAAALGGVEEAARGAVERVHSLAAREDALKSALADARARAGAEHLAALPGVLGTLLDLVEVDEGYELAFEAAAEEALASVVVDGRSSARRALDHLRSCGVDGAVLPLAGPVSAADGHLETSPGAPLPSLFTEPLRARVRTSQLEVAALLDHLLAGVVLCRGELSEALDLAEREYVVVTLQGDRFSKGGWRLGAGRTGATRVALEAVAAERVRAGEVAEAARRAAEEARQAHAGTRRETSEMGRGFEAVAAEHRQTLSQRDAYGRRLESLVEQIDRISGPLQTAEAEVVALEAQLVAAEAAVVVAEDGERRERAVAEMAAEARRQLDERARALAAMRAELEVRAAGIEERTALLSSRRDEIERRLAGHEAARRQAAERRQGYEDTARVLERLSAVVDGLLTDLEVLQSDLSAARRRHESAVADITRRLRAAREQRGEAERGLSTIREQSQRVELDRAEARVRLEAAAETLRHDLDCEPGEAVKAECPELAAGTSPAARLRELERELRLMGPINPLAVEELGALVERDQFLTGQLEDVRSTRRELGRVIKAVDDEIIGLFSEAFSDVAAHFSVLFATLFPGGTGHLSLLDPTDLLSTGVEIEARPAGRNIRRLSLLSGGERSLVALAFLFAVFRSRPSPFYLMDEVEAALDDLNLHRFLDLVGEFRNEAQLLIVSHQKRTMESADILYGVSMQPGGASKVVSERLGDRVARAPAG